MTDQDDGRRLLDQIGDDIVGWWLKGAAEGHHEATQLLLQQYVLRVETRAPIDARLEAFVLDKLWEIGDNTNNNEPKEPNVVFSTYRRQLGRPTKVEEHLELAVEVAALMRDGSTEDKAVETVADRHPGVAADTIRNQFQFFRDAAHRQAAYLKARMGE